MKQKFFWLRLNNVFLRLHFHHLLFWPAFRCCLWNGELLPVLFTVVQIHKYFKWFTLDHDSATTLHWLSMPTDQVLQPLSTYTLINRMMDTKDMHMQKHHESQSREHTLRQTNVHENKHLLYRCKPIQCIWFNHYRQRCKFTTRPNLLHALQALILCAPSSSVFSEDRDPLASSYESQTMSSARRLVWIFLRSLSRWRLPCALPRDDDGLADDGPTLAKKQTLLCPSAANTSDFRHWPFGDFFITPFFSSCKHNNISALTQSSRDTSKHCRQWWLVDSDNAL